MCTEECEAVNSLKVGRDLAFTADDAAVFQAAIDGLRCEEAPPDKYCCIESQVINASTTTSSSTTTTITTTTTLGNTIWNTEMMSLLVVKLLSSDL